MLVGVVWDLHLALLSYELLQLLNASFLKIDDLFGLPMNAIVRIELFLQLDNPLITLIEA